MSILLYLITWTRNVIYNVIYYRLDGFPFQNIKGSFTPPPLLWNIVYVSIELLKDTKHKRSGQSVRELYKYDSPPSPDESESRIRKEKQMFRPSFGKLIIIIKYIDYRMLLCMADGAILESGGRIGGRIVCETRWRMEMGSSRGRWPPPGNTPSLEPESVNFEDVSIRIVPIGNKIPFILCPRSQYSELRKK